MLARLIATKQLTLPDELLESFAGVDCFQRLKRSGTTVLPATFTMASLHCVPDSSASTNDDYRVIDYNGQ